MQSAAPWMKKFSNWSCYSWCRRYAMKSSSWKMESLSEVKIATCLTSCSISPLRTIWSHMACTGTYTWRRKTRWQRMTGKTTKKSENTTNMRMTSWWSHWRETTRRQLSPCWIRLSSGRSCLIWQLTSKLNPRNWNLRRPKRCSDARLIQAVATTWLNSTNPSNCLPTRGSSAKVSSPTNAPFFNQTCSPCYSASILK